MVFAGIFCHACLNKFLSLYVSFQLGGFELHRVRVRLVLWPSTFQPFHILTWLLNVAYCRGLNPTLTGEKFLAFYLDEICEYLNILLFCSRFDVLVLSFKFIHEICLSEFVDSTLQTCLSEGKGYHFPCCNMLDICGFRILFDCPLDLSSLSIFSLVPMQWSTDIEEHTSCSCHTSLASESTENKGEKIEKPLDGNSLIHAEPRYKAVKSLKMLDVSFIDVVLISSLMGMLGLPLLTRREDFFAKVWYFYWSSDILNRSFHETWTAHDGGYIDDA